MQRPDPSGAAVIIPAAGAGTRMGGDKKQYRLLGGKPLVVQTVLRFELHRGIRSIVIAVPTGDVDEVWNLCREFDLSKVDAVVEGGDTRQASVRNGLESLDPGIEIVLTHDAVRPFVSAGEIDDLLNALVRYDAAVLAAPLSDTLCRAADDLVVERVDRRGVFRLLTPQAFRRDVLERGHMRAESENMTYTDEVTLVKAMDTAVALVMGTSPNLKITRPVDWQQALWMWPAWEAGESRIDNR